MNATLQHSIHLTQREIEILRLIEAGHPSAGAANKLFISTRTVDHHLGRIYTKFNVKNRIQAVNTAKQMGLLQSQDFNSIG